jgi:hypothetical protein
MVGKFIKNLSIVYNIMRKIRKSTIEFNEKLKKV